VTPVISTIDEGFAAVEAVSAVASTLLRANGLRGCMRDVLRQIGEAVGASRACLLPADSARTAIDDWPAYTPAVRATPAVAVEIPVRVAGNAWGVLRIETLNDSWRRPGYPMVRAFANLIGAAIEGEEAAGDRRTMLPEEIRTPMEGTLGIAGLLAATAPTEEQREDAESVRSSVNGLLTAIHDGPAADPTEKPATEAEERAAEGARRVLVAEDNPINQQVAVRILERLGCEVDLAANGREAVQMSDQTSYDLIFMDCMMPEMDGFAATREIRRREGRAASIPIVALTAHAVNGAQECLDAGMNDFLAKPVTRVHIEQALLRWSPRPAGRRILAV
jgi:CheY-like chemotaxis protein